MARASVSTVCGSDGAIYPVGKTITLGVTAVPGTTGGVVDDVTFTDDAGASITATKSGQTYVIAGHAIGVDMSNPMGGLQTHEFQIEVTCP